MPYQCSAVQITRAELEGTQQQLQNTQRQLEGTQQQSEATLEQLANTLQRLEDAQVTFGITFEFGLNWLSGLHNQQHHCH